MISGKLSTRTGGKFHQNIQYKYIEIENLLSKLLTGENTGQFRKVEIPQFSLEGSNPTLPSELTLDLVIARPEDYRPGTESTPSCSQNKS